MAQRLIIWRLYLNIIIFVCYLSCVSIEISFNRNVMSLNWAGAINSFYMIDSNISDNTLTLALLVTLSSAGDKKYYHIFCLPKMIHQMFFELSTIFSIARHNVTASICLQLFLLTTLIFFALHSAFRVFFGVKRFELSSTLDIRLI